MKENFELVGEVDVAAFKNMLAMVTPKVWDEYDFRQKKFSMHKHTKTIPLILDPDPNARNPKTWKHQSLVKAKLEEISELLRLRFGDGLIQRAILVKLPANTDIPPHVDKGPILTPCMRCHLPIVTNPNVFFTVGDEVKSLPEGQVWQINNSKKRHSVLNNSAQDRIHLIVDWRLDNTH